MMFILHRIVGSSETPMPLPSDLNPSVVNPGIGGAVTFTFLAVALVLLLISMNRRIRNINFEEDTDSSS